MNTFRKVIDKRKKIIIVGIVMMLVLNIGLQLFDNYSIVSSRIDELLGFYIGLMTGLLFLGILAIYKYTKALKDEQSLKKLYIDEHDERKKLIKDKMAKSTVVTGAVLLVVATSVAIYFEPIVAITLICVMYVMVIIALGFKIYYSKKF